MEQHSEIAELSGNLDKNLDKKLDLASKTLFAILTLLVLWLASGTHAETFWSRVPFFSLIVIATCAGFSYAHPSLKKLLSLPSAQELKTGYFIALVLLVPTCALMIAFLKSTPALYSSPGSLKDFFSTFPLWTLIPLALAAYFIEFFDRAYLGPKWGAQNVVLLEALVCGIAFQHVSAFIAVYLAGLISIYSLRKWSLRTTALMRFFWTLMLMIGLRIASA